MLIETVSCVVCGDDFGRPLGVAGRPRLVCSDECHKRRAVLRMAAWQKANPERTAEHRHNTWAKYYAAHRRELIEKSIQYGRDHPEWKKAQDSAHRALRIGSPNAERFTLDEIYERDGHRCHLCGKVVKRPDATVDHIVPASLGGPHTRANVALAHRSCNASKGNRVAREQLRLIG